MWLPVVSTWILFSSIIVSCVCQSPYSGSGFQVLGKGWYFHFNGTQLIWNDARLACKAMHPNADLAVLYDVHNYNLVHTALPGMNAGWTWIGLFQNYSAGKIFETEFNYTWIDGTPNKALDPYPWGGSEPNGFSPEDFGAIAGNSPLDAPPTFTCSFICGLPGIVLFS
jgi:hypothetical protein